MYDHPINNKEPFYSFHVFLFPFEWQYEKVNKTATLEEKTALKGIISSMDRAGGQWERRSSWLKPTTTAQYNEANYFYDFVRPVLYDSGAPDSLQAHYYHKMPGQINLEYVITLPSGESFRLEVDDMTLSLYSTGVGVLSFHLYNRLQSQSSPNDILKINQFGRRLYPPFLTTPLEDIGKQSFFESTDWLKGLEGPQQAGELPKKIALEANGKSWITETYAAYQQQPSLEQTPGLVHQLLPKILTATVTLTPVLDDRMFVLSWYGNKTLARKLQADYLSSEWWYKMIFVDVSSPSCKNKTMFSNQLQEHTYHRWTNNKVFFGLSRYSFVSVSENFDKNYFSRILVTHFQTLYFKMVLLCLIQKACLLRFSAEVTWISQMVSNDRLLARKVSSLYKQYLRFVNKIYFREVTAQEQGIELYSLLQDRMHLNAHVKDLEGEVSELHNYVSMLDEEKRNDKLDILTYIGAFFVVPSFIVTYLSLDGNIDIGGNPNQLIWIGGISMGSAVLAFLIIRASKIWRLVFLVLLGVLMLYITFFYALML